MAENFKNNQGNQIRMKGEEYVEDVLKKNNRHHAQNNPKEKHTQKP